MEQCHIKPRGWWSRTQLLGPAVAIFSSGIPQVSWWRCTNRRQPEIQCRHTIRTWPQSETTKYILKVFAFYILYSKLCILYSILANLASLYVWLHKICRHERVLLFLNAFRVVFKIDVKLVKKCACFGEEEEGVQSRCNNICITS